MKNTYFKGYRFPKNIIFHVVWLYHRFTLSLRDISELMLERGFEISHESIRQWGIKFDAIMGKLLKRRAPRRGDKWYCSEQRAILDLGIVEKIISKDISWIEKVFVNSDWLPCFQRL